jgi:hypothetical protein
MVRDLAASITRLVNFLGLADVCNEELVAAVARASDFEAMKAQAGDGTAGRKKGEAAHIRKGGVGGWQDYLTVSTGNLRHSPSDV